jgi:hypothetical protein
VTSSRAFAVERRETLFPIGPDLLMPQTGNYTVYDITPDDQRFVILRLEERETRESILATNWLPGRLP